MKTLKFYCRWCGEEIKDIEKLNFIAICEKCQKEKEKKLSKEAK